DLLVTFDDTPLLHLCVGGIRFLDHLLTEAPQVLEVVPRRLPNETAYDLIVDERRFAFAANPADVGRRLERVFRYYDQEFRPRVAAVHRWRSPAVSKTLRVQNAVACPECRHLVVARVGEVGIPMDVAADLAPPERPARKNVG